MNIFEKLHRKLFPNDYVTPNVVSYAFLLMAEDICSEDFFADVPYTGIRRAIDSAAIKFQLTVSAQSHLTDEVLRYLGNYRGGIPSGQDNMVLAFCLLSAMAESEDEECQK